jgi:HemY protein
LEFGYDLAELSIMTTTKDSKAIAARLKKEWNDDDVRAFAEIDEDPLALLKQAEKWLADRSKDAELLCTCARLAIRAELFGRARSFLEASIAQQPWLETYLLLAHMLEHLDDRERAYKVLKTGVAQAIGRKVSLPKIRMPRVERRRADRRKG